MHDILTLWAPVGAKKVSKAGRPVSLGRAVNDLKLPYTAIFLGGGLIPLELIHSSLDHINFYFYINLKANYHITQ